MAVFKAWVWFLLCIFASLTCNLRTEKVCGLFCKDVSIYSRIVAMSVQSILCNFCSYLAHKGRMFNCCVMSKMHGRHGRLDWISEKKKGILPCRNVLVSSPHFSRSVSGRWKCSKKFTCRWKYKNTLSSQWVFMCCLCRKLLGTGVAAWDLQARGVTNSGISVQKVTWWLICR